MKSFLLLWFLLFVFLVTFPAAAGICPQCQDANPEAHQYCSSCGYCLQEFNTVDRITESPDREPHEIEFEDVHMAVHQFANSRSMWPHTSRRLLTHYELRHFTRQDLVLIRNEIYARHGWIFQRRDLDRHFSRQSWYRPAGNRSDRLRVNAVVERSLSAVERKNIELIRQYERK